MGDMREEVARAIYTEFIPAIERLEGSTKKQWDDLDPDEDAIYLACWMQMSRAALEACHFDELVEALKDAHEMVDEAMTQVTSNPDHDISVAAELELGRRIIRAVLAKVEAGNG